MYSYQQSSNAGLYYGISVLIVIGVLVVAYFLLPKAVKALEKWEEKKAKQKQAQPEVLENVSILNAFVAYLKLSLFFFYPSKRALSLIDRGIVVPLSDMFGENGEANATQSLHRVFNKYITHLYTDKQNKTETSTLMEFEGLGGVISSFRKKELLLFVTILAIYLLVIINVIVTIFTSLLTLMLTSSVGTVIFTSIGFGLMALALLNALYMIIVTGINAFSSINFLNQQRLSDFIDLKLGYSAIKAKEQYGDIADEAYKATVQTILSQNSRSEYFANLDTLRVIQNEALQQLEPVKNESKSDIETVEIQSVEKENRG